MKQQLRRAHHPHAAVADLDAGEHLHVVGEHLARVEAAVAVLVFEDEDAVAQAEVELLAALGVGVVLGDPQPPARVPRHRDRVLHVRLGGEDGGFEAGRQPHLRRRLGSGHRPRLIRLRVVGNGKLGRAQTEWNQQQQQRLFHGLDRTLFLLILENNRLASIAAESGPCESIFSDVHPHSHRASTFCRRSAVRPGPQRIHPEVAHSRIWKRFSDRCRCGPGRPRSACNVDAPPIRSGRYSNLESGMSSRKSS